MSKVRICIEDGVIAAVYSDDPNPDIIIYDFDSDYGDGIDAKMRTDFQMNTQDTPEVRYEHINPFFSEIEEVDQECATHS